MRFVWLLDTLCLVDLAKAAAHSCRNYFLVTPTCDLKQTYEQIYAPYRDKLRTERSTKKPAGARFDPNLSDDDDMDP